MNNTQLVSQDNDNTLGTTNIDFEKESDFVLRENSNRWMFVISGIVIEVLKVSDYVGYIAKYGINENE